MLKRILTGLVAIVGASTIVGAAQAATPSYTTANVNLRAGPGTAYPVLVTVPNGTSITTYGCLDGYNWCDVSWGTERGWMSASYIQVTYQGQPRIITPAIAPSVGLTVVVFNRAYWDRYYYGRPWYSNWDRYYRPPPRPPMASPRPPASASRQPASAAPAACKSAPAAGCAADPAAASAAGQSASAASAAGRTADTAALASGCATDTAAPTAGNAAADGPAKGYPAQTGSRSPQQSAGLNAIAESQPMARQKFAIGWFFVIWADFNASRECGRIFPGNRATTIQITVCILGFKSNRPRII